MNLAFPLLVICAFLLVGLSGPAQASQESYTFRYVTGSSAGGIMLGNTCVWPLGEPEYTQGGACKTSCPDGRCRITVTDDVNGENVRFRVRINDDPFYQPHVWWHTKTLEADYVSVAVLLRDGTMGTITIEAA